MKIKHYLYNSFIAEWDDKKIAIDPGALFFYYFRLTTLIPKSEWQNISHIFVTHGDPDHYWHTDRVLKASGAIGFRIDYNGEVSCKSWRHISAC